MAFKNIMKKPSTKHIEASRFSKNDDIHDPLENSTLVDSAEKKDFFQRHIKQYTELISWAR